MLIDRCQLDGGVLQLRRTSVEAAPCQDLKMAVSDYLPVAGILCTRYSSAAPSSGAGASRNMATSRLRNSNASNKGVLPSCTVHMGPCNLHYTWIYATCTTPGFMQHALHMFSYCVTGLNGHVHLEHLEHAHKNYHIIILHTWLIQTHLHKSGMLCSPYPRSALLLLLPVPGPHRA